MPHTIALCIHTTMVRTMNKQTWDTPALVRYGTVEELTAGHPVDKDFGGDDGVTFQSQPIGS